MKSEIVSQLSADMIPLAASQPRIFAEWLIEHLKAKLHESTTDRHVVIEIPGFDVPHKLCLEVSLHDHTENLSLKVPRSHFDAAILEFEDCGCVIKRRGDYWCLFQLVQYEILIAYIHLAYRD